MRLGRDRGPKVDPYKLAEAQQLQERARRLRRNVAQASTFNPRTRRRIARLEARAAELIREAVKR